MPTPKCQQTLPQCLHGNKKNRIIMVVLLIVAISSVSNIVVSQKRLLLAHKKYTTAGSSTWAFKAISQVQPTSTTSTNAQDFGGIGIETADNHHPLSSSNNYTWIGNHWVPPPGVPTFTALQIRTFFQKINVLFIGDSTGRRSYNTMFALINAQDVNDISVQSLEGGIDVTKGHPYYICPQEKDRALYNSTFYQYICRDLNPTNGLVIMNTTMNSTLNSTMKSTQAVDSVKTGTSSKHDQSPSKKGKFDYTRLNCYGEVYDYVIGNSTYTGVLGDYNLVVIAMGLWDVIRDCSMKRKDDVYERLNMTLHALEDVSNADLQIAFRTPGLFAKRVNDPVALKMIQDSNAFFESRNTEKRSNLIQVDWGSIISKRSWKEKRINGDVPAHYGLEARLLFIQQLMHQLVLNDSLS